jgi:hypothetical protein
MNILNLVSKQQEVSPKLKKLQASCKEDGPATVKVEKEELKKKLSPIAFSVTQQKGTERLVWKGREISICFIANGTKKGHAARLRKKLLSIVR